jgi:hypothetical protein
MSIGRLFGCAWCALVFVALASDLAFAQPPVTGGGPAETIIKGPPAPVPPEVIVRDQGGRVTIRAVRLEEPLNVDGRLDEAVYQRMPPVSDFIQQEPQAGQPATEQTDVWLFYDDRNVYITGRMWDSQPDRIIANEMRRDNFNIFQNDNFAVAFDTYYNQRTGFFFQTNALGGLREAQVTDEGQTNFDWDTVWDVGPGRFEGGWITEIVIPFKSLRYEGAGEQVWGVNFRRIVRWKNEVSTLSPVPPSYGTGGVARFSTGATLVGIEPPPNSRNIELKPSLISDVVTNRQATPPLENDVGAEFGFDAKYGLTRSLIADFTYNTDFAQVEADEQQVNLSRFSLFFPEKREFFLEGQNLFEFGGVRSGSFSRASETPIVFFSRRIGLENGQVVPIQAGGRLTGRAGAYSIGVLNIRTGESELAEARATNFSVVRVRRDILRRSTVGMIVTHRAPSGGIDNDVYGLDTNLSFYQDIEINAYYARSHTPDREGDAESYRGDFNYNADRYGVRAQHLKVGDAFNPEMGFLRRSDFRENFASLRFSPRPELIPAIRKFSYQAQLDSIVSSSGQLETRAAQAQFGIDFENGDTFDADYTENYDLLREEFEIADQVVLPVGGYTFGEFNATYNLGGQRKINGRITASRGQFYSGDRTAVGYNGRLQVTSQLSLEPRVDVNWVNLPEGIFTTKLISTRVTYTASPRMFVGALIQYNSSNDALTTNIRFRWEYDPGSDLFVVFSEGRDTLGNGPTVLQNRGLVVKFTRLFRL